METWTRRLRIIWRPTLGFFRGRYDVLSEFEERKLLHNFRVQEDRISVRLGDPAHVVGFGPGRIELSTYRPNADVERMRNALAILTAALEPGPARMSLGMQALEPLELEYGEARNRAAARLFPDLPSAEESDFAFMLESRQGPEVRWKLDAGILERAELPPRLSREHSRVSLPDRESPTSLWPVDTLPEVAMFCDGEFDRLERVAKPTMDELVQTWDALSAYAEEVASLVFRRLSPTEEP